MKSAVFSVILVFAAASASAQSKGDITVNIGNSSSVNCTTNKGETGFNAANWSISGTNASNAVFQKPVQTMLANLIVSRNVDTCSEQLFRSLVAGTTFPTLVLTQYGVSAGQMPYSAMVVTLTNVMVDSYSIGGTTSVRPSESVSFAYSQVCIATTPLNADGSIGRQVSACYNMTNNTTS